MGEFEEKVGADFLRLLHARQRFSVLDSKAKKMIHHLNVAISLLDEKETGYCSDDGVYHVHSRPYSGMPDRQLALPTVQELNAVIEYRKQAKDEIEALDKHFKEIEAKL